MNFIELTQAEKEAFHQEINSHAMSIGSKNALLQMIEDLKKESESPLSSKEKHFSFSKGFVTWDKFIYKETLDLLFTAILRQEREGDLLEGLKPREQKRIINMLKTLKPVVIQVKPKNVKEGAGFSLPIIDASDPEKYQVSLMFKALFFYNIRFAKDALGYSPMPSS